MGDAVKKIWVYLKLDALVCSKRPRNDYRRPAYLDRIEFPKITLGQSVVALNIPR